MTVFKSERERDGETERGREKEREEREEEIGREREEERLREKGRERKREICWLVGFLTSSSTTRLYRGRAPRQSV